MTDQKTDKSRKSGTDMQSEQTRDSDEKSNVSDSFEMFRCGNCGDERHGLTVSWWTDCEECGESNWVKA